ncbi:MAG: ComF family protein [Clostridiales bacterium]|nr:ComF family protein [Clostridiales bacterium]
MNILSGAADILLPHSCSICSSLASPDSNVTFDLPSGFHICGRCLSYLIPLDREKRWLTCLSEPYKEDPYPGLLLYMPFPYNAFFSVAVRGIKFSGKMQVAAFMGRLLGQTAKGDKITADASVAVPLSKQRLKERGFNQAQVICEEASSVLSIPVLPDALLRTRETGRQAELSNDMKRSENVRGAFEKAPYWDITGLDLLLFDDVATTGNTLHEAACALIRGGAGSVLCIALCGNRNVSNAEPF